MLPGLATPLLAGGYVPPDPDARAYVNAMSPPPTDTRKRLLNDLIVGLKADGVWALIDRMSILAAHSKQAAFLDVKQPTKSLLQVGTVTFAVDLGVQASGNGNYLTSNEVLGANGTYYNYSGSPGGLSFGVWQNAVMAETGYYSDYVLGTDDVSYQRDYMTLGANGGGGGAQQ